MEISAWVPFVSVAVGLATLGALLFRVMAYLGQLDKRYNDLQVQIDKRYNDLQVQIDKRYNDLQVQIDKRYNDLQVQIDKRYDDLQVQIDQRYGDLEAHLKRMEARLGALTAYVGTLAKEQTQTLATLATILAHTGQLAADQVAALLTQQARLSVISVDAFLDMERAGHNPLTAEEVDRLQRYVDQARRGEMLSVDEVHDYNAIVAIAEREHPEDLGVWTLAVLGAFLRGLILEPSVDQRPAR